MKLNYKPKILQEKIEEEKEEKLTTAKTGMSKQEMLNTALSAYEGGQPAGPMQMPASQQGYGRTN